jgi:hypothetical protein
MTQPAQIDPRGHRFNAVPTALVIVAAILTAGPLPRVATSLVVFQLIVFVIGGFYNLSASPYAQFFKRVIRPRIGPPSEWEDAAPPAFSQVVGAIFLGATVVALLIPGGTAAAYVALSLALVAALLNATVGLCLGCELYLLLQRLQTSKV